MTVPGPGLDDIRSAARTALRQDVWDFVEGGSGAETTLAANRTALDEVELVPRVLSGVSAASTRSRLLGVDVAMPMAVAPMAYQRLVHPDGELAAARAARSAGVPYTVSTLASARIEDVAATGAVTWFQLYWLRSRRAVVELVRRAEDSGCGALVVTVDVPIMGRRSRDRRNRFVLPETVRPVNVELDSAATQLAIGDGSALARHTGALLRPGVTWHDITRLRALTSLPIVLKGLLDPRDAVRAVDCGADAVVVSNHGGRQLDGAVASARMVAPVVAAVEGRIEVLLDGGVRSGTDVLRALALGATGVLLGRPVLWGLAAGGEAGVTGVLSLLRDELRDALILAGCADPAAGRQLATSRDTEARAPADRPASRSGAEMFGAR